MKWSPGFLGTWETQQNRTEQRKGGPCILKRALNCTALYVLIHKLDPHSHIDSVALLSTILGL